MNITSAELAELQRRFPHVRNLEALWRQELGPALTELEAERKRAVRTFRRHCLAGGGAILAVAALLALAVPYIGWIWGLVLLGLGGFLGHALARQPLERLRLHAKEKLAGRVATLTGLRYSLRAQDFPLDRFRAAGLTPGHNRSTLEDELAGTIRGVPLRLCDARLAHRRKRKNGHQTTTVFLGLLIQTPLPGPPMEQTLLLTPNLGRVGNFFAGLARPARIEGSFTPDFAAAFEVHGRDQAAALNRLTPALQQCLLRLASLTEKPPSLALSGSDLLIALPRSRSSFESFSPFQPFDRTGPLETLLEELDLLARIVEALELPPSQQVPASQ